MKTSIQSMAIASVAAAVLIAAPLAMAKEKDKSAANDTKTAKVEKFNNLEKSEGKEVAYLGVGVESLHPAFWAHLRDVLEHQQGLMVVQVAKDSPADKAGVKEHDILMTYGDQKLFSPEQLIGLVHAEKVGHDVKLGIVREGKTQEVIVTVGEHAVHTARRVNPRSTWRFPWFSARTSPIDNNSAWESFDSMTLKSLGDHRYKVDIGYETQAGKIEHRAFEGTREEIHRDIMVQKDLPINEREHLLRSLDMPGTDFQFGFPVYTAPDGRVIWDLDELNSVFWPMVPNEF